MTPSDWTAWPEGTREKIAAAIANARGMRRGVPTIVNILDILPEKLRNEVLDDAENVMASVSPAPPTAVQAADAKLIEAVDRWILLMQPVIASAKRIRDIDAQEREARNRLAQAAAEWAVSRRDPRQVVEAAIRARGNVEGK